MSVLNFGHLIVSGGLFDHKMLALLQIEMLFESMIIQIDDIDIFILNPSLYSYKVTLATYIEIQVSVSTYPCNNTFSSPKGHAI